MSAPDRRTAGDAPHRRLDSIPTPWSLILRARGAGAASAAAVRNFLAVRYHDAVRKYLSALLWRPGEAAEVTQQIMVRILEGRFDRSERTNGRFRDYLKAAVRNEAMRFLRSEERRARHGELDDRGVPPILADMDADLDRRWVADCRQALLNSALHELETCERRRPQSPHFTVLRLRREFPDDDSETMAARLSRELGRQVAAGAARQQLRRARAALAQILVDHVAGTLTSTTPEEIQEELIELGLMDFVRRHLEADSRPFRPGT